MAACVKSLGSSPAAFWAFSTLERVLSYLRLCRPIWLQSSKSRGCQKRALWYLSWEGNATHGFHVSIQGVNGHKCSQLCVCLRRLIRIAVPHLVLPRQLTRAVVFFVTLPFEGVGQAIELFTCTRYVQTQTPSCTH